MNHSALLQVDEVRGHRPTAQAALDKRVEQLGSELKSGVGASAELDKRVQALASEQAALKAAQGDAKATQAALDKLDSRIKSLAGDVQTLQKQGDPSQAIRSLEQDLLVLRSELDNRPAASAGPNTAEFDAFRAQMTRNINTLQSQMVNLQQQIDRR